MPKQPPKHRSPSLDPKYLPDFPRHLQSPPNNRHGGHNNRRHRTYGGSFGPASDVRYLSPEEIKIREAELLQED